MRHATAGDAVSGRDIDRPLNEQGRLEAAHTGAWLRAQGWLPDHVVCSPAQRTRETYALAMAEWPKQPEPTFPEALYNASATDYAAWLAGAGTRMIVGHNPAMDDFIRLHAPRAPPMLPGTAACFEDGAWVRSEQP